MEMYKERFDRVDRFGIAELIIIFTFMVLFVVTFKLEAKNKYQCVNINCEEVTKSKGRWTVVGFRRIYYTVIQHSKECKKVNVSNKRSKR